MKKEAVLLNILTFIDWNGTEVKGFPFLNFFNPNIKLTLLEKNDEAYGKS